MVTANWFISASEARNNIVKSLAVHGEISAIEHEVMLAVQRGDYEVTVRGQSPFTQLPATASEVFTVDAVTNTLEIINHPFKHGDVVTVSSTQQLPPPLQPFTYYYVIYVDANHIKLASSRRNVDTLSPISINIAPGVGSVSLVESGSRYVTAPSVTFSGGSPEVSAQAVSHLSTQGVLQSVQVLDAGGGFTYTPSATVSVPGSGAQVDQVFMKVVSSPTVSFGGANYNVGETVTLITGAGTPAASFRVTSVDGGSVTQVEIISSGKYVSTGLPDLVDSVTTGSGVGSGCRLNIVLGIHSFTLAGGGLSYAQPPIVSIQGGGGSGARAQAQLTGGIVTSLFVLQPGSGFTGTPTVSMSSGTGAQVAAQLSPTRVSRIDLVNNGGVFYTNVPQVQLITPGAGATPGTITMKVMQVLIQSLGQGYVVGDQLYVSGGAGSQNAVLQVTSITAGGGIGQVQIVNGGAYTTLPTLQNNPVYGGTGINAYVNLLMGINEIQVQTSGGSYVVPPGVVITGSASLTAQAQVLMSGDEVQGVRVIDPGLGYTAVPNVEFTCGSGAQARALLTSTSVRFVDIVNPGSGYTEPPTVTIQGGGGTGAIAEAEIDINGSVSVINVIDEGSGYTSAPDVIISGNATAQASLRSTTVDRFELLAQGTNYVMAPSVVINDGSAQGLSVLEPAEISYVVITNPGSGYVTDPVITWTIGLEETGSPRLPVVRTQRSFSLSEVVITNPGTNYQTTPTITIGAPAPGGVQATATAQLSVGSGIFHVTAYTPSQDYWKVNCGQSASSDLLTRPYKDQIASVTKYFTDLGYSVVLETNPVSGTTLQWTIRW